MNIDDFMNQSESYNKDSKSITGFFNLNEDVMDNNIKELVSNIENYELKSDIIMSIDALTDSKLEGIVLSSLFFEKIGELSADKEANPLVEIMKISMACAICTEKGFFKKEDAEEILEVFSKVFSSM